MCVCVKPKMSGKPTTNMICKVFDCQISGYNVSSERVRCGFLLNILEDKY